MTTDTTTSRGLEARRTEDSARARLLLIWEAVAGPLFMFVIAAQVLTREGFDLRQQP